MQLEKRISALESTKANPLRWVWRELSENLADAMRRIACQAPIQAIVFQWKDSEESANA